MGAFKNSDQQREVLELLRREGPLTALGVANRLWGRPHTSGAAGMVLTSLEREGLVDWTIIGPEKVWYVKRAA